MGLLGSTSGLTPSLDALARESVVFTGAFSQAPITTVSHATILTGTFPPFHRVTDFGAPLSPAVPYVRFQCTTRRVPTSMTTKTDMTRNVAVMATKKSHASTDRA
jgi:arylsulfatase A-like enzyme